MSLGADYGVGDLADLDDDVRDAANPVASDEGHEGRALKQIDKTRREILKQKQKLEINHKKKMGILPGQLEARHVQVSFLLATKPAPRPAGADQPKKAKATRKVSQDMFILSSTNRYYIYWISLNTLCCLASSYVYACLAAFKVEDVTAVGVAH